MPDITMCKGFDCPMKERCKRYRSQPSERQSWFATNPHRNGECNYFIHTLLRGNK